MVWDLWPGGPTFNHDQKLPLTTVGPSGALSRTPYTDTGTPPKHRSPNTEGWQELKWWPGNVAPALPPEALFWNNIQTTFLHGSTSPISRVMLHHHTNTTVTPSDFV